MASRTTLELKNRLRWPVVFQYGLAILLVWIAFTISALAQRAGSTPGFVALFLLPALGFLVFVVILGVLAFRLRERTKELENVNTKVRDTRSEFLVMSRDLQESKARFEEAQRVANVGYWIWNLETDRVSWSDETYRIFGLSPQADPIDIGTVRDLIHAEDRESVFQAAQEAIVGGARPDSEHRVVRPDGEVRTVHSLGDLKRDTSGRPYEMFGTVQDITDRKRAEEALHRMTHELRRQQAYLAEAQSFTHTGSWAWNVVTREIYHSSDENARLYGFDPSEGPIPWERFYETVLAEDEPQVREQLESAVRAGEDYQIDLRIRRNGDGSIRLLHTRGHHVASDQPGDYFGTTMDVTDRKHAELERDRLRQLEADLSHINRVNMMGELAAALAHEIKQPIAASITSASTCLRWLAYDPPNLERARAAATRSELEGNRAADVIDRLRSLYKKGKPPERHMVDVGDVIGEMTALLGTEATRHGVVIHSDMGADTPRIVADRVQLQQVFMNLMLNAIEAMKGTGGELTIRVRSDSNDHIIVSISDTGVGLPSEGAERIFEPFQTTKPEGMGMGLAITRSIVESHGGRVWATANEGAGATFHLSLSSEAGAHA